MRKSGRILTAAAVAVMTLSLAGCSSVVDKLEEKASSAIGGFIGDEAGDIVGNLIGGSSNDEDGTDSMPIKQEESKELMTKLAEKEGYQLTFSASSDGEASKTVIGQTADAWWNINDDNSGSGYAIEGDVYHFYDYYDGEWNYSNSVTKGSYGDLAATLAAVSSTYLYMGNMYDGLCSKSGTASVAGRKCDVYTYSVGMEALGYGYSYKIYIDQEYGFTLKMEMSATAGSDSGEVSYEVLDFVTGSKVKKPGFPAPDSYSVTDMSSGKWPDNEFTALIPSIPSGAEVTMTVSEGDSFSGVLQNVSEDDAHAFIEKIIDRGFGDADCVQEYEGMIFFDGSDEDGRSVAVTFMSGSMSIAVNK